MSKELYVSSTPHETKVAVVEDDQLAEIYFERENEYTLAGSIYKGRVTRVLPGMQSAFVNIGLERDAFLYVSDFFEMEDEDEQIEPVNVRTHRNAVGAFPEPQAQRPEPIQAAHAEGAPAMEFTGGYDEPSESPAQGDAAAGEEGEAGARRWRGRRRRRGGRRGRGMPEAKFAEGEARPEGEEPSAEPMEELVEGPGPVQLPGESLSQHARAEESREEQEPEASDQESAEATYETEAETETPDSRPPAAESRPDRVVLPGESFTPRQPRSEASGFDRDREPRRDRFGRGDRGDRGGRGGRFGRDRDRGRGFDRGDRGERHERQEVSPPPAGYEPIILPGESLSKYKGRQPASPAGESGHAAESIASGVVHDESPQETMQHGEPPVIESPSFQQEYAETPVEHEPREIADESRGRDSQSQPTSTPDREQPRRQPASSDEQRPAKRGFFDRFRSMNVAEIFGGKEAEADTEPELAHPPLAEPAPTGAFSDADVAPRETQGAVESQHDESHSEVISAHHAQPVVGAFEEEEIDEEETDLPAYADQFADEDGDFEELEEETLEPAEAHGSRSEAAMGEMLTETVEEHESDQAAAGSGVEAYEGEDGEGEFEEEEASGRAELRAPAGTAGYQQRAPQRPQFDRHGRGRRGGRRMRRVETRPHVMISDVLKEGQEVLVQIAKEPIGKKGARITSHIALPGRFLVYMPTVNHIGVSRKIASDEERQRLKRIVTSERENGHGGFIVRTAAENVREDELRNDIRFLKNLWNEIKNRTDNSKPPALIYHDLNLVERILRDLVTEDFTAIWVDTEQEYERVLRFVNRFQPNLVRRVKLYTKETPLFEQFGIQEEINKALKSKVWLKSGGYIVINQTEALVAIDVNTGKYVGKTQRLEDTIVKTNVDAIREIVRQIRLRDLGGIIVIDFIDMDERRNRQKVMAALEDALRSDRSPSKVLQFNDFGLVAITRKRVKHSLERTLGNPCPYCTGTGLVKSVETVCNEIFTEMKKMARHLEGRDVMLRVNPEVAKALKENNGRWLSDYEELTGKTVIVKSDALLHQEQFDMH